MQTIHKQYIKYVLAAALLAVGVIGYLLFALPPSGAQSAAANIPSQVNQQQGDYISYVGKKDSTALAQLKEQTEGVTTKPSSFGEYVDSIGAYRGGQDGKYWRFYVDGKMASVGASTYVSKGGETIEWKFEKVQ